MLFASGLGLGVLMTDDTPIPDFGATVSKVPRASTESPVISFRVGSDTATVETGNGAETPPAPYSNGATVIADLGAALGPEMGDERRRFVAHGTAPAGVKTFSGNIGAERDIAPPADDQSGWRAAAQISQPAHGRPMIAIVMDDLGLDIARSNRTVDLPPPLTLAYLPYAKTVSSQAKHAKSLGHEILLHMPMEPSGQADPGPNALLTVLAETELQRRVSRALDRVPGAIGLNNHMGSRFTSNALGMRVVMRELRSRGLLFLDSLTSPRSAGGRVGAELSVPTVTRDIFLDDTDSREEVRRRLEETERVARRTGTAIAIGHPRDNTLLELAPWLEAVQTRGFVLVPLSQVVRARLGLEERHAAIR